METTLDMMEDSVDEGNRSCDGFFRSLKIRKDVSVALWDAEKGLGEVAVSKGKLWCSMGVMRSSKLLCNAEEAVYLVVLGSLVLLHKDIIMSVDEVYSLLLRPAHGCSWAAYQTFAYLKRLGYIVGRHGVPWTNTRRHERLIPVQMPVDEDPMEQSVNVEEQNSTLQSVAESDSGETSTLPENLVDADYDLNSTGTESSVMGDQRSQEEKYSIEDAVSVCETVNPDFPWVDAKDNDDMLQNLSLLSLNKGDDTLVSPPMYDVFLPNGQFRKSSPGLPAFRLCISGSQPPKHSEVHLLELKSGGVPLKFATVESGHVSIFSFQRVSLSDLP